MLPKFDDYYIVTVDNKFLSLDSYSLCWYFSDNKRNLERFSIIEYAKSAIEQLDCRHKYTDIKIVKCSTICEVVDVI